MPKADNLPPSCAVVTKSGNLNVLQPSGPVQACNGTALPLNLRVTFHQHDLCTPDECIKTHLCFLQGYLQVSALDQIMIRENVYNRGKSLLDVHLYHTCANNGIFYTRTGEPF